MKPMTGLSLLELIVSLGILSILLSISIPDFSELTESIAGDRTLRKLASAIQLSKAAAITNGTTVTLCGSGDGVACGRRWQDGVIIFTDRNRDQVIDEGDTLIRHITFPNGNGHKQTLQLTSLGTTAHQNGNFTYCPFSGNRLFARQLIINRTARLRFAQDKNDDGIREDSRGRPLSCG